MQRLSAVALVFLGLWFLLSLATLDSFAQDAVVAWIVRPWNSIALLLLGFVLAYHSSLGVQVVIEDYVHAPFAKVVSLVLNKFAHFVAAAAATVAVLRIAFGSA